MNTNTNNVAVANSVEEERQTSTFSVDKAVFNGFKSSISQYTAYIVRELADVYEFDYEEAMARLDIDVGVRKKNSTEKRKKDVDVSAQPSKKAKAEKNGPAIILPWCGIAMPDWCQSIRNNHGLYTQCTNLKQSEGELCVACSNEKAKTTDGNLKYGLVNDRPEIFKKQVSYAKIMAKHNISKEDAINEAEKFGWTIPESAFDEKANGSPRGRPKKVKDTSSSDEAPKSPAKRGRPSKTKPVESASAKDDMLDQMIQEITKQTSEVQLEDETSVTEKAKKTKKDKKTAQTESTENPSVESTEESPKKKRVISDETKAKMAAKRAEKAAEKAAIKAAEAKAEQEKIRKQMEEDAEKNAREQTEIEVEEGEEIELELTAFAYKGTQYARDDNTNNVYTMPTDEDDEPTLIGVWDKKTKTIIFNKEDDSELEEEEHDD
jgi:hypothetical protein